MDETGKFIALILRHKPEVIGITIDKHGWADVNELIAGINKKQPFSMADLEKIVETDNKQRYSFNGDKSRIRANQGHSIKVDVELDEAMPSDTLYHGTGEKYASSIIVQGLISKSRLYVHLTQNIETAISVGKRHGDPIIFCIDCKSMVEDGYKFYLSANGVWLTEKVPAKYLKILE